MYIYIYIYLLIAYRVIPDLTLSVFFSEETRGVDVHPVLDDPTTPISIAAGVNSIDVYIDRYTYTYTNTYTHTYSIYRGLALNPLHLFVFQKKLLEQACIQCWKTPLHSAASRLGFTR